MCVSEQLLYGIGTYTTFSLDMFLLCQVMACLPVSIREKEGQNGQSKGAV
jgi:hypothetical protein